MQDLKGYNFSAAISDFREARRKATMREIVARLTGTDADLLSYEEVRRLLKGKVSAKKALQEIPIDAIIGSVNRYDDFTRDFLPRETVKADRWAMVEMGTYKMEGLPPIEVYQIGEAYFVIDGNHRVSVAKSIDVQYIQAYVTRVETRVEITPDIQIEELLIKHEYTEFLEKSNLDKLISGIDLSVTTPDAYQKIEEHISVHRYFMGIEQEREIPYQEAVVHWFNTVYMPVINIIRQRDLIYDFPGRTETDLYVWIVEHRKALEEEYGEIIESDEAAKDFTTHYSPKITQRFSRLGSKLRDKYLPDVLGGDIPPGSWRQEREQARRNDRLFNDLLVPIDGSNAAWTALEQAITVAEREDARIQGLMIVENEDQGDSEYSQRIRDEFLMRCLQSNLKGSFSISTGSIAKRICDQSRWHDLTIFNLSHPPGHGPLEKLSSGIRYLVQHCPSLLMSVPNKAHALKHLLLAYDGSIRAREALYVATYLVGKWGLELTVVSVNNSSEKIQAGQRTAQNYLEKFGVQAQYVQISGELAKSILKTAYESQCDTIVMGGYSSPLLFRFFSDSLVDQLLRQSQIPILLCR